MTIIAAIAAAAALTIGAPAAVFANPIAKSAPAPKAQRYCVVSEVAGSRFTHYHCKTRDAWIKAEGFDPAK